MSNDATRKAAALRKVAEALRAWGKFKGANSPEALEATRTALDLATHYLRIIMESSITYGRNRQTGQALVWLQEIAAEGGHVDLGKYRGRWDYFTQPCVPANPLSMGFPDDLERWAEEFDKAGAVAAPRHEAADVHASGGKTAKPPKAEKPINPTLQKAAAYICRHHSANAKVIAKHCGVEPSTIRNLAKDLKKMGFTSRRGCTGGYWPPDDAK